MANTCFRIQGNKGCELPSNVVFLDCYAEQGKDDNGNVKMSSAYTFKMGYALAYRRRGNEWYARSEKWFDDKESIWAWLRLRNRPKEPCGVFAFNWHFVGQACGLWQEIDEERFSLTIPERKRVDDNGKEVRVKPWNGFLAIDDMPFVVYLICKNGTLKLTDVRNYYDVSMQELSDTFNYGRIADIDSNAENDAVAERLRNRVETVSRSITSTMLEWRKNDRGNWQPTAARLAWSNWRHQFSDINPVIIDNKRIDRGFERQGYFGGEVNHWFRGKYNGPVYKVDCVGLYASQMLSGLFPTRILDSVPFGYSISPPEPDIVASCMAEITVYGMGDLPMRELSGKVSYPCGQFHTVLCGSELLSAWRCGRVLQWHRYYQYALEPIFRHYIAYWNAIKTQAETTGDRATRALAKIMMNSLYGRFAQKKPTWTLEKDYAAPIRWGNFVGCSKQTGRFEKLRAIAGVVQRRNGFEEKTDTWPAISAIVTSNARAYIRNIRSSLPVRSVLAQSTDSFLLTEAGYECFNGAGWIAPDKLGRFRFERTMEGVEIVAANQYTWCGGETLSGASSTRSPKGERQWNTYTTRKTGQMIACGLRSDVPVITGTFVLTPKHDPRVFDADGWTVDSCQVTPELELPCMQSVLPSDLLLV